MTRITLRHYPSNSKAARELGLTLTLAKTTYIDMVATLLALGVVKSNAKKAEQ